MSGLMTPVAAFRENRLYLIGPKGVADVYALENCYTSLNHLVVISV